ncbi:MAG: hypothetical protein J5746_01170 [Victivallales bacterium]|nr:hypothetical protein [Victivallales bacterium]
MVNIDNIVSDFNRMVVNKAPVADIAALLGSLRENPAYLELLGAMSVNSQAILNLEVLRQWPEEYLSALSLFLLRLPCIPIEEKFPCGKRELAIAEALQNESVPKITRVQLWRTLLMDGYILPYYKEGKNWNMPSALYEHPAVRRWLCLTKHEGWEDLCCTDSYFFGKDIRKQFDSDEDKQALAAIENDLPSALMMPLSIRGENLLVKYAWATMTLGASRIATYLYSEGNKTFRRNFSPRRLLLFACANWNNEAAIPFVIMLEKDNPGLVKNTIDAFGHDALWYTLYKRNRFSKLTIFAGSHEPDALGKALIELGCDPGRQNSLGLSYIDLV